MAQNEPSHQDLHYIPSCFDTWLRSLFGTMGLTRFKDGRVHFRKSGMKGLSSVHEITRQKKQNKKTNKKKNKNKKTHTHTHTKIIKIQLLSLSRPRLSRITAYLEVKIGSLPKHEHLTTGKKYCRKEEKLLLRSNFFSFPQYFQYISNFKSNYIYSYIW